MDLRQAGLLTTPANRWKELFFSKQKTEQVQQIALLSKLEEEREEMYCAHTASEGSSGCICHVLSACLTMTIANRHLVLVPLGTHHGRIGTMA